MTHGNTTRGKARWERAALNAVRKPNSQAAKLYRSRVVAATELSESVGDSYNDVVFRFMRTRYTYTAAGYRTQQVTDFTCCSSFCAMMEAQLRGWSTGVNALGSAIESGSVRLTTSTDLQRAVKCHACGDQISKGKS